MNFRSPCRNAIPRNFCSQCSKKDLAAASARTLDFEARKHRNGQRRWACMAYQRPGQVRASLRRLSSFCNTTVLTWRSLLRFRFWARFRVVKQMKNIGNLGRIGATPADVLEYAKKFPVEGQKLNKLQTQQQISCTCAFSKMLFLEFWSECILTLLILS